MNALVATQDKNSLSLKQGSSWLSFEQFRKEGAKALASVKNGIIATLHTKNGQYRILEEKDFQKVYGLARDIERLQGGLRIVITAARAVQKHPDDETIKVLIESVNLMGSLPALPTREHFEPLEPEAFEEENEDEDDEYILDPEELERLIAQVSSEKQ
ncbi:MAG TPA: hypothetical protein DCF68_20575 [Cyanothece sp. UBA12306]|nr:hypothetical protein [Cyanothece sp. UBA12306]